MNKYLVLGHLVFWVLFIFAFTLAFERVLYIDSGAQVFEIIKGEGFEIYAERYSMYLSQLLPVLAVKLHLPLSVVIYAYSLSTPVIGYLLWLITVYFLKDRKIGILMLFVMLGIKQTFFHSISETFQLLFFASFLYAWLFQSRDYKTSFPQKLLYYLIACVCIALCVFIHPVAVFFVIFILGIYLLHKDLSVFQKTIITVMSIVLITLKLLTTTQGSHDATFMISAHEFFNRVVHIFALDSTKWYFARIIDFYWMPLLMLIVSLFFYWKRKKYWYFAFLLGFMILFWTVTVVIYANDGGGIAMERSFLPLFFFCSIPFAIEVFPKLSLKWNKIFFIGLTALLVVGFTKIAIASIPYTQRLKKIEQISAIANQQGKKKILMTEETAKQLFPVIGWGLGFESMLYSASKGADSTVNIYMFDHIDPNDEEQYKNVDVCFGVSWWIFWGIDELNPHYLKLPKQLPSVLTLENGEMVIKDNMSSREIQ